MADAAIKLTNGTDILSFYPVGSIYMSVVSTDPSTLFGGTWERIQDRFLLAAGSSYNAGDTGGEASHALSYAEMEHKHTIPFGFDGPNIYKSAETIGQDVITSTVGYYALSSMYKTNSGPRRINMLSSNVSNNTASAHNNMPPYLTVYMWKRTA